jgi:broad specificity phosphatase PhoE
MSMPNNLILIRHGESEGNVASKRSKEGDHSVYTEDFKSRHSSLWRLSKKGREQAVIAGEWLKKNLSTEENFYRCYTSEYIRAMETASLLNIEDAFWYSDFYLRERNYGDLDRLSLKEREERFADSLQERKIEPLYWTPPNGESLADVGLRVDRLFQTLHRECENKNVVVVCHGEVMRMIQVRLERMTQEAFNKVDSSQDSKDQIYNCQIMWYSRVNPENEIDIRPYISWVKSICPWDKSKSSNEWRLIPRQRYTNEELMKRVERIDPLVN